MLDFEGLTAEMRQDLAIGLRMVYTGEMSDTVMDLDAPNTLCFQLGGERRSMTWRYERIVPDKGDLKDYWIEISYDRDFLGAAPSYVHIRDPGPEKVNGVDLFYLRTMDHGTANVPYLLAQYLFHHAEGRKGEARLSGGHFIGRLAMHFGLVSDEGLRGLQAAAAGAHEAYEGGPAAEEVAQEIPAPTQVPLPPPPTPQARTMSQRIERVEEDMRELRHDLMDASGHPYQAFGSTLVGSSQMPYQRRIRPRTRDASTSAAPHADDQPDP
ncbi:hypothetical protein Tco_1442443 [Tanacetum coccineum]